MPSHNRIFYQAFPVITIFFTELFFDLIVTNYILTNCLKIQQNFLRYYKLYWNNSEGYNLNFTAFYRIQKNVRHLFLFFVVF